VRASLLLCLLACGTTPSPEVPRATPVGWQPWSAETFARAAADERYLLVSVQAGWCHWCHVMNHETFGDPRVQRLLADRYLAIKVDSDARPDLADRFRDYAWPATVLLTPDAEVVLALRGYRAPEVMMRLLAEVADGRAPVDTGRDDEALADLDAQRTLARATLDRLYDRDAAGWGRRQKYPYAAPVEHAFYRAIVLGEEPWRDRALATLEGHRSLVDPVFGGVYQYSLRHSWTHPHYEKIAAVQAGALRTFAEAYRLTGDERWREAAGDVLRYLREQLRDPRGGFYTSQDADLDAETPGTEYYALDGDARRVLGYPRVDRNVYAGLNGRMLVALAEMHRAVPDAGALDLAREAAAHLETHRAPDGGFWRGAEGGGLRHLDDQAWMLRGLLALYEISAERAYLEAAERTAAWIVDELSHGEGGFHAHTEDPAAVGVFAERRRPLAQNGVAARGLLRLHRLTHEARWRDAAVAALRAVGSESAIRSGGRRIGEYLLALEELRAPYVLVSVVGPDAEATSALHRAALALPLPQVIVELGRPGDSRYPYPGEPAAYLCNAEACSIPVAEVEGLEDAALRFLGSSA